MLLCSPQGPAGPFWKFVATGPRQFVANIFAWPHGTSSLRLRMEAVLDEMQHLPSGDEYGLVWLICWWYIIQTPALMVDLFCWGTRRFLFLALRFQAYGIPRALSSSDHAWRAMTWPATANFCNPWAIWRWNIFIYPRAN